MLGPFFSFVHSRPDVSERLNGKVSKQAFADAAEELALEFGFDVTAGDVLSALNGTATPRSGELTDGELHAVAGGVTIFQDTQWPKWYGWCK